MGAASACRAPALTAPPYDFARPGAFALALRPALFTAYRIDGTFTSMDFASGDTLTEEDGGDIRGRAGGAVRAELWLNPRWMLAAGADFRRYDVEGLTPTEELDVSIETIDSLQYFVATRHLFPAVDDARRLRPFAELSLAYLPHVDVGFEVDLSSFGSSNLAIDSRGDGYWLGGLASGLVYQLADRWLIELGVLYERALSDLDVDLSFEIVGTTVPLAAELRPHGFVGFAGLTFVL